MPMVFLVGTGYDRAYREFYRWSSIAGASRSHGTIKHQAKHFFYASGWKKFEPLWNFMIRARQLGCMTPLLEAVLSKVSQFKPNAATSTSPAEIRTAPNDLRRHRLAASGSHEEA